MHKKKVLVTLLILILLLSFSVVSFTKDLPGDRAGRKADHLWKNLKLSDDQYVKVYHTLLDYEMKVDAMKLNKMAQTAKDEQLNKMQENVNTELGKIFTKDQNGKFSICKAKFHKMSFRVKKKKVVKTIEMTDEKKEVKKEVKKDDKKDFKKEEKKDIKKD